MVVMVVVMVVVMMVVEVFQMAKMKMIGDEISIRRQPDRSVLKSW